MSSDAEAEMTKCMGKCAESAQAGAREANDKCTDSCSKQGFLV
jgi:hypothetical protein